MSESMDGASLILAKGVVGVLEINVTLEPRVEALLEDSKAPQNIVPLPRNLGWTR